jgi:type II secretory pathway pseudopilin PulG
LYAWFDFFQLERDRGPDRHQTHRDRLKIELTEQPEPQHPDEDAIVAIVVRCECGKEFQTRDENAGRRARCPVCQRELIVPEPKPFPEGDFAPLHDFGPPQTSGKAIASLVLGICSLLCSVLAGVPAIIFGILGLADINDPRKRVSGKGLAISGIVLGSVTSFMVLIMIPVLIALLLPAVQAAREAARRAQCTNNLKQIGLAMHNYASTYDCFPPAATYDQDGKPLLSWRVLILPFLEAGPLYGQFHLDEAWDSPHNKPLADQMPIVFRCPSELTTDGVTTYEVVVDPRSIFTGKPQGVPLDTVTDGISNTLLVMESTSPVPWSKPADLSLKSSDPLLGMGSKHPGGFNAMTADGAVRFFKVSISPQVLKALVTRNGSEPVNPP